MPAAVETEALVKRYPKVEALKGLTLSIGRGEIFALLGPNGAGKTTWISIVCGLVKATSGSARVLGHDVVRDAMSARRAVGLVPQEINFDPFFTSREVLRFQMGYFGVRAAKVEIERRIDELLEAMDLTAKADANTRELSGGMKRRLLIAKSLVHRPGVVFLDEPTAGVDISLRRDLWAYVRTLRKEGTTIVLTTHYLEEAEALADRVAVIDEGELISLDTPTALLLRHGRKRAQFRLAQPLAGALPDELKAMGATLDGQLLECPLPEGGLAELLSRVSRLGAIADVTTSQPSLEDVFLTLTDRAHKRDKQNGNGSVPSGSVKGSERPW
jgi:ABC-2 type transport system ATP-binding protein